LDGGEGELIDLSKFYMCGLITHTLANSLWPSQRSMQHGSMAKQGERVIHASNSKSKLKAKSMEGY